MTTSQEKQIDTGMLTEIDYKCRNCNIIKHFNRGDSIRTFSHLHKDHDVWITYYE